MKVVSIKEITKERIVGGSLPDIDTDFPGRARGKVKDYMAKRFGKDHVASVGAVTTLQIKSSIKDLSKQLTNDFAAANYITGMIDNKVSTMLELFQTAAKIPKLKDYIKQNSDIFHLMPSILNQPKAKSIHPCAIIIFPDIATAAEWAPTRTQNGLEVIEWSGVELEKAGFLKEDMLSIKQLDKFENILSLIEESGQDVPDIYNLPIDTEIFRYFSNGWNGDIFQFGSEGQSEYINQLKPNDIKDLIAATALYRPGPMENHYHEIYAKCKNDGRKPEYLWGTEEITKNTYALYIYQEQIMQVCQQIGGLSLSESDFVRKSMGKKDVKALLPWKNRIEKGYLKNGASKQDFEKSWKAMLEFAKYGFNKCLSGDEIIRMNGANGSLKKYTIKDMYELKNGSREHAKKIGSVPQYAKYKRIGNYGSGLSLEKDERLRPNTIVDIRYSGKRQLFKMTLEDGKSVLCTNNHKFPTSNGEKMLMDIDIENDLIFVDAGYQKESTSYCFTDKGNWNSRHQKEPQEKYSLNIEKGKVGFQKRNSSYNMLKEYTKNHKKDYCENNCGKDWKRLEVHHIDGNHGNNDFSNLKTLCSSCHKEAHYKMGRVKKGQKGLLTKLIKIKSIEFSHYDDTYDVEMKDPNHNFLLDSGIVTSNSHAAAYALTAYVGQYLKVHYPLEYWTTALNYADEKKTLNFLSEIAQAKVITILPPDINDSAMSMRFDSAKQNIYWGIDSVKGIGENTALQIIEDRDNNGTYKSLPDFIMRHSFKGSRVKKQTYEALIASGAFDTLEKIERKSDRQNLIEKFRKAKAVKISNIKKDSFSTGRTDADWWWLLKQKALTGLAFIDYEKLISENGINTLVFSSIETNEKQMVGLEKAFGGYVVEYNVGKSKKGKYARITIEHNYKLFKIVVWSEEYNRFKELLDNCEKSIILFTAELRYEAKWTKGNQFTFTSNSKLVVLK